MKPEKIERRPSNEERLEILRDLFPEVFADGRVNAERLREVLADSADDTPDDEHYGLRWPGKQRARRLANQTPQVTLRLMPNAGIDDGNTGNMLIVGDNLQVLLALQQSYANSIKLIYIDPPYNTGNDLVYNDRYSVDEDQYLQETSQADVHGRLVSNPQTTGRFHSNWLNMMHPRLRVSRTLLRDDGVICVSIDDNEVHNLRHLLDELFGSENHIGTLVWKSRVSEDTRAITGLSTDHEYILCYRKSELGRLRGAEKDLSKFSNPDNDPRGPWRSADLTGLATRDRRPNLHYDLVDPSSGVNYGCPAMGWRYDRRTMKVKVEEGRILWPSKPEGRPRHKLFVEEIKSAFKNASSVITGTSTGEGTRELNDILGAGVFSFPKPTELIRFLIEQATDVDSEDIILDFFAGSGTTGHSTWRQNAKDGGNRRFILVQLPEEVKAPSDLSTIDMITCERLRRASSAMAGNGVTGDLGFRVLSEGFPALARPPQLTVEQLETGQVELFQEKRAQLHPADLFSEVLLLLGFPLDAKREQVPQNSANTLWCFEHPRVPQPLLLCLDPKIDEDLIDALRGRRNYVFVCRDEALTDVTKARLFDALRLADSTLKVL